jgi:hypothetical protein
LTRDAKQTDRLLASQKEEIAALRARLAKWEAGDEVEGVNPERIVWVFGSGKTGSTWLSDMMKALPHHTRWNEPQVGYLFGHLYYRRDLSVQENFILGSGFRETWLNSIRSLVLEGATVRYPEVAETGGYLVIKEPHGSIGAPLLMEALPESRMVFLMRDPRDVAASALHTTFVRNKGTRLRTDRLKKAAERPDESVEVRARIYLQDITLTKQAYEAHEGRKVVVRYEDLKANALAEMKRIYSALEIPVDEVELSRTVEEHAFESIPNDRKGPGTVRRRGTSGGWREDLSAKQVEIVESITAPILEDFYGVARETSSH